MTSRERKLLALLAGVGALAALGVGAIQLFGGAMGAPCADSYACRGFLIGGAECVQLDDRAYCTRYCRDDSGCPLRWQCLDAHPTALTVETHAIGRVCVRSPEGESNR